MNARPAARPNTLTGLPSPRRCRAGALALSAVLACALTPALVASPTASAQTLPPGEAAAMPAASAPAAPASSPSPAAVEPVESCASVSDRAMSADLNAATAQAQKVEPKAIARLLDEATALWTLAGERCTGRARERAQANASDNARARAALGETMGAGAPCTASQRDATALQDLAQQAVQDRRFIDAARLYRRAEHVWELASERCTGQPQKQALERVAQVAVDAHNAEHCAPHFDRARQRNQRLRHTGAALGPAERQTEQQVVETLWREAAGRCKGQAQDVAQASAATVARERGTAWVPTAPVEPESARPPSVATSSNANANATLHTPTPAVGAALPAARVAAPTAAASVAATPAGPATTAAAARAAGPVDVDQTLADGFRITGRFELDEASRTWTGRGRLTWPNGDVYEGDVRRSQRHGQGSFTWANGQRYEGGWVDDVARGQGKLRFANGNVFEGSVVDGQPQGEGRMTYASGDDFEGGFEKGTPHGRGRYRWINGDRFDGPFDHGQARGEGRMQFANGNVYEGTFAGNLPQGKGKLTFASGDVYEGDVERGAPHGQGRYTWKHGDVYVGAWRAGRKQGKGEFTWAASGNRFVGEFVDDQPGEGDTIRK